MSVASEVLRSLVARRVHGLPATDAFHLIAARPQAAAIHYGRDPAIAIAAILAGETDDALRKQVFVEPEDGAIVLFAPRLARSAAATALRDAVAPSMVCTTDLRRR